MNWNNLEEIKKNTFDYIHNSYLLRMKSGFKKPKEAIEEMKKELYGEGITQATILYPKNYGHMYDFLQTCQTQDCYNDNFSKCSFHGEQEIKEPISFSTMCERMAYLAMFDIVNLQLKSLESQVLEDEPRMVEIEVKPMWMIECEKIEKTEMGNA